MAARSWSRTALRFRMLVLFLALAGGGWYVWSRYDSASAAPSYRTEKVSRGSLVARINASGTLEPEDVVDVGAQVQGQIRFFGRYPSDKLMLPAGVGLVAVPAGGLGNGPLNAVGLLTGNWRPIDYGSPVEEGTVLLQLDDSI